MLENFTVYLRTYADNHSSIFEELLQYRFTKKPIYSANIIRYSLLLRYTSIQSYKVSLQDFPLPLSLLQKISSGTIDAVKCANALRIEGKISEDVCMIFDEMYLQKRQEYFWGEMIGCDDEGELYKDIVCFMIVVLKESIPYVIKSLPKTNTDPNWLNTELLDSLEIPSNCGFGVVLIIHRMCLVSKNCSSMSTRTIYFCYDVFHVIKNIRNNLLKCKRFIFPLFEFSGFKDPIFERDANLHGHLRKALKLRTKVLHHGNYKQNVANALAIFDETTIAAVKLHFLENESAVVFLTLFSIWCICLIL